MAEMDVREKLVELLQHDNCPLFMVFGDKVDVLADYLIANGVTVQEWISVKDRLPENTGDVIVCHKNGWVTKNAWLVGNWWHKNEVNPITHWTPLPQPPKGE